MIAAIVVVTVICCIVLTTKRFYDDPMAALVAWVVGVIIGGGSTGISREKSPPHRPSSKPTEEKRESEVVSSPEVQLSRPVGEIIANVFDEEFSKLPQFDFDNLLVKLDRLKEQTTNVEQIALQQCGVDKEQQDETEEEQSCANKEQTEETEEAYGCCEEKKGESMQSVPQNAQQSSIIEHYNISKRKTETVYQVTKNETLEKSPEEVSAANVAGNKSTEQVVTKQQKVTTVEDFSINSVPVEDTEKPNPVTHAKESKVSIAKDSSDMTLQSLQVRVLTLNNKEHGASTLYRIQKGWVLQFRLGPSLFGRKITLLTDYPTRRYEQLEWRQDEGCHHADDTASYAEIVAEFAGSFRYSFRCSDSNNESESAGSGFFLVDPVLKYGNEETLPLDCIQCQTVLTKSLGPFGTWEDKLMVAKETGYNMIHFTPIQELGESNSSYSLAAQLKLNPIFSDGGKPVGFEDVGRLTAKLRKEWKMLSICDIVLNHTANETDWLQDHPDATYNCLNCPYLRPAYLLDAALYQFSIDVIEGVYEPQGVPVEVNTEDHLNAIRHALYTKVLPVIDLAQLYICDTNKLVAEFSGLARGSANVAVSEKRDRNPSEELGLVQDAEYRRLATTVDMKLALQLYNVYRSDCFDEDTRLRRCIEEFKNKLDRLNREVCEKLDSHLGSAVENAIAGIRYFRVQRDGPRIEKVTVKDPLVPRYFTDRGKPGSLKDFESLMYSENSRFLMAHNGWVMDADPLSNFASPTSNVYLRRELIAWGDSVKLRYGEKPEDSPFLWRHMRTYVEETARIFDGVRLDNCHSTPIAVAEYLLGCARKVRPDLYVVAELFTNSDQTDNIFVNRLGITSLIREAMSAWDSHEEGRLVYRYGGEPVGAFFQPPTRPLVPSVAHALFLDLTHDNPSPVEKRSVFDLLPSSALVGMACCASGSNRGYDELVPHHIHVVDEKRQYREWQSQPKDVCRYVSKASGIIAAKRAINDLHFWLGQKGFRQVYVDQIDADIVAVTRHCPETHESVVLVAFTAFNQPGNDRREIKPLRVEGILDEIVLEASLQHKNQADRFGKFERHETWINGLEGYEVKVRQHVRLIDSEILQSGDSGSTNVVQLNFKNFKPGSVVAIKVSLPSAVRQSVTKLHDLLKSYPGLSPVVNRLDLADLNRAIYRCDQEERDEGYGFGAYDIPNFGPMVYCGVQGLVSLLSEIRPSNDLGHPMCCNLRDGNWMIDHLWQRLKVDPGTKDLGNWIEKAVEPLKDLPRYLVPCYFDLFVTGLYLAVLEKCFKLMTSFVSNGSTFVKGLALGSVQFGAVIKSAELPTLSPSLSPPAPPTRRTEKGELVQACVTLSAGLPHFSSGYMRNWGRDTFIALRGLFILTGRYQDARYHILGYAGCLRHGLIPNLLDGGKNSRYNCRDAVWWWLYCVKSYAEQAPNGMEILSDKVSRIFPADDSAAVPPGASDQTLSEVIQEALAIHFQGLRFRERNAGRQIDAHMADQGFNNNIGVHPETGFVFGGNGWNCGTWMDKMGSSDKAGNRGRPATPRDGSAVELIGLSKCIISWLDRLHREKLYPHEGVERTHKAGTVTRWTFKQWAEKIRQNFEKHFWIDTEPAKDEQSPELINKRGIYKDSHGSTHKFTDFQLRCNFPIAMVAAPELFDARRAWVAIKMAEERLLGPLGMKTLDADDWAYRGDYDNSNDSNDPQVSHGFNYHQGPEWVWPVGFLLRAKLHFAARNGQLEQAVAETKVLLSKHFVELQTSPWRGLPELTNSNGSYCKDSSRTQAWSMSCILEVLDDLQKIESMQNSV